MRKWILCALVAFAVSVTGVEAYAQPALKMMIPANPGGGWDQTGRNLAAAMQSAKLVSSVQFDNKGGAGGTIGLAQFVNSSKGDPNAMMIGGMVMVGAIYLDDAPVNLTMVTPLARLTGEYEIIVVPANRRTRPWPIWSKRSRPIPAAFPGAAARPAAPIIYWSGLIAKATGVDPAKINYVPFKGGGEAIAAIVGGHVTAGVSGVGEFAEQIKGGRMRALAVSCPRASTVFPPSKNKASMSSSPTGAASLARQGLPQRSAMR